jgi:mutual gliding-motility protein MglA
MDANAPRSTSLRKIVYYGPGMAGKATNFQTLHRSLPSNTRSDLYTEATEIYRMLYMTITPPVSTGALPVLYRVATTPGCVLYTRTRTDLLQNASGVVCVFDSQSHKLEENLLSLRELTNVLRQRGCSLATFPIVLQYNKRDVPGALSRERLDHYLNPRPWPVVEAIATRDQGVMETFRLISSLVAAQETGRD